MKLDDLRKRIRSGITTEEPEKPNVEHSVCCEDCGCPEVTLESDVDVLRDTQWFSATCAQCGKTWELTKEAANYRPAKKPQFSCKACKWMFPRLAVGSCKYVRGVVEATATCDEFEPRNAP